MIKKLLTVLFTLAGSSIVYNVYTSASGQTGAYSGAPSESNCTSCHTGTAVTSGTKWDKISLTSNFTGNGYIPDSTYTVTLKYIESGKTKFGFLMTCLDAKNDKAIGTSTCFTNLSTGVRTMTSTTSVSGNTRYYIGHNSSGTSATGSGGTDTVTWSFKWKAPSSNIGDVKFYVSLNVTNNNGSESGDAIYTKSFTLSPSSLLPTAKAALADTHACQNYPVNFKATTTGSPTSYTWKFPSSSSSTGTTTATPTATYTLAGTYSAILSVKNTKGVSNSDTFKFTVKAGASIPSITPSGTANTIKICQGDSVTLTASNSSGSYTYLWSPGAQTKNAITVKDSNVYSVIGTASTGCKRKSANITVLINKRPSLQIIRVVKKDTFCLNDKVDLILLGNGPSDSFKVIPGTGLWDKNQTYTASSSSAGTFKIDAYTKSVAGCISPKQSYSYTVFNADAGPTGLSVSNITYTGFRVSWNSVAGASGYEISKDSGKTFITPSSGSTGLYHDITGLSSSKSMDIYVRAINNSPCGKTMFSSITGTTKTCPNLNFTIEGPSRICSGTNTVLKIHGLANSTGAKILVDGISQGHDTLVKLGNLGFNKTVEITAVDSNALLCGSVKKQFSISVDQLTMGFDLNNKIDICTLPTSVFVLSSYSATTNADSSKLVINNVEKSGWIAGASHNSVSVRNNDSVWLMVKKGVCNNTTQHKYMNFTGLLDGKFTSQSSGYNYTFTPNDTNGTHTWKAGNLPLSNSKFPTFDLSTFKGTNVKVMHSIYKSPTCAITDSSTLSIKDLFVKNSLNQTIKVYPNPVNATLNIELENLSGITGIELVNSMGQVIYQNKTALLKNTISMSRMAAGVYYIKVSSNRGLFSYPVTKE